MVDGDIPGISNTEDKLEENDYIPAKDDPEYLWNTYMKGVKLHDNKHKSKKTLPRHGKTLPPGKSMVQHGFRDNDSSLDIHRPMRATHTSQSVSDGCKPKRETVSSQRTPTKNINIKTASDVISRVLWDPDIPAEYISVGYIKGYNKINEKPFNSLIRNDGISYSNDDVNDSSSSSSSASLHDVTHIVYFKYRNDKIWDKNERLDLVFGSTKSSKKIDIRELIVQIEKEYNRYQEDFLESDNDDSDESISLPRPSNSPSLQFDSCDVRPNYFVAIRITDPDVLKKIGEVKLHMSCNEPKIKDCYMSDNALHITLAMLYLPSKDDVERAVTTLNKCWKQLTELMKKPITVSLEGLKTFSGFVLYIPVVASSAFYDLRTQIVNHLKKFKVHVIERLDFVPHVTLLKLTKSRSEYLDSPNVDSFIRWYYSKNRRYGTQECNNINLCAIGNEKRSDGFYKCALEMNFCRSNKIS